MSLPGSQHVLAAGPGDGPGIALSSGERAALAAAALRDRDLAPQRRRREGIVHTPPELARFAARAADDLLTAELGFGLGLADPRVAVIDPACGPGAFLAAALAVAGARPGAPGCVLGCDRDPAAIALADRALGSELARAGWPATFERCDPLDQLRPETVAGRGEVCVVLGNPPWIGSAQERPTPWLDELLEDFRCDAAGARLRERKLGVLADAYVRFFRWSAEVARCAPGGAVVVLVSNASYLDGAVHRGMRAALRRVFDAVRVLDLGGSALVARGAGRDDNVFGVRPGAAVIAAVRRPPRAGRRLAGVWYLRLTGPLARKLAALARLRLCERDFRRLRIDEPFQRFVPTKRPAAEYARWPSLADAMPFHREGVQTNRDAVVVDADRDRLIARLVAFAEGRDRPELGAALAPQRHYDPERARAAVSRALASDPDGRRGLLLRPIAYRPFEVRWFAPVAPLCHRPRPDLLCAMDRSQLALVTVRKDRGDRPWAHFAAARFVIDNCLLSTRSSCRARAFPTHTPDGLENLSPAVAAAFAERAGRAVDARDFVWYALAVLASPRYRARYADALRVDYPHIPPPATASEFEHRRSAGEQLAGLLCAPEPGARAVPVSALQSELACLIGRLPSFQPRASRTARRSTSGENGF